MVPHYSGTTLDAQKRYAEGVRDILERYFAGKEQEPQNLIVQGGAYATTACESPLQSCRYRVIVHLRWSTLNFEALRNQCSALKHLYNTQSKLCKISLNPQITIAQITPLINTVSFYSSRESPVSGFE